MELTVDANEVQEKDRRVRAFLQEQGLAGLLLSGTHGFAWATCGRDNHVVKGAETGVGHALYTPDAKYLLCDNIEEPRLKSEERLEEQGFRFVTGPWYTFDLAAEVGNLIGQGTIGADTPLAGTSDVSPNLAPLRYGLTAPEQERYRWLGKTAVQALETTATLVQPGMTEHQVGAILDHHLEDAGVVPWLTLVAADERIERFRHPIPTGKTVQRYVMYVTCATRWGLIACATRLVHFGPIPSELARKHEAVCFVDTVFNTSTRPGAHVGDIFARAQQAYDEQGFGDEWTRHHQGGATGYAGRDYKAVPGMGETVALGQAFAWNPSITGTKTEDTILVHDEGPEVLTAATSSWPTRRVETPHGALDRPLILER